MGTESASGAEYAPGASTGWRRWRVRLARRILPRSLLGRMLLIGFIPLLATQAISLELFYGNYLQIVSRRLSNDMATTISMTLDMLERYPSDTDRKWILEDVGRRAGLVMTLREGKACSGAARTTCSAPLTRTWRATCRPACAGPPSLTGKRPTAAS